jgi:hypothetical protein
MSSDPKLHHPSILTLAVTFCGGLIALHLAVTLFAPQWLPLVPGYKALVWRLQLVIALATLLYLVLRRGEGDFCALFIVALGLFAAVESLGALARWYGFLALNELAKPFNVALFIFSSLGLSAAVADRGWHRQPKPGNAGTRAQGGRRDRHHFALVLADLGFLFLSCLRGGMEMRGLELNDKANVIIRNALAVVVLCVGAAVLRAEVLSKTSAAGSPAGTQPERNGTGEPPGQPRIKDEG